MVLNQRPTLNKTLLADAAIQCFSQFGPQRASMADIAEEAGASRQSIYRFFEDRSALLQFILEQRISAMARQLKTRFDKYQSIDEALVDGSLESIMAARSDELVNSIITSSTDHSLE